MVLVFHPFTVAARKPPSLWPGLPLGACWAPRPSGRLSDLCLSDPLVLPIRQPAPSGPVLRGRLGPRGQRSWNPGALTRHTAARLQSAGRYCSQERKWGRPGTSLGRAAVPWGPPLTSPRPPAIPSFQQPLRLQRLRGSLEARPPPKPEAPRRRRARTRPQTRAGRREERRFRSGSHEAVSGWPGGGGGGRHRGKWGSVCLAAAQKTAACQASPAAASCCPPQTGPGA